MPNSPHLPPPLSGVVLDAPSDYQEYDELLELMAEDRRRRALVAEGRARAAHPQELEHYRQRMVIGFDGVSSALTIAAQGIDRAWVSLSALLPLLQRPSRAARRARGRQRARAASEARHLRRQRINRLRAQRPAIKKKGNRR